MNSIVAVALVLGIAGACSKREESSSRASNNPLENIFEPGALRAFILVSTDTRPESIVYTLTNQTSVAKIEVLDRIEAADAETLLQDGVMGIHALYANALSPYPGDISNQVTTEPAFRPRFFRTTNAPPTHSYFLLYANDRFGYGATTKDAVRFKSLMGWFYCSAQQKFVKVKLFVPTETSDGELEKIFTSLRCK